MVRGRVRRGLMILAAIAAGLLLAVFISHSHADGPRPRARLGVELPPPLPPRTRGGEPGLQRDHPSHYADRRAPRGRRASRTARSSSPTASKSGCRGASSGAASRSITSSSTTASSTSVRDENNVVNLPPSSNAPTPERARRLDIRSLTLNGLDVQYEDKFRNWGVKVPRIESRAAQHGARRDGRLRRTRQPLVPPARSHHDDVAVRDGDDLRWIERRARAGPPVVAGDRSVPERRHQARPRFAVTRSRAQGQHQSRQGDQVGAARRPCR